MDLWHHFCVCRTRWWYAISSQISETFEDLFFKFFVDVSSLCTRNNFDCHIVKPPRAKKTYILSFPILFENISETFPLILHTCTSEVIFIVHPTVHKKCVICVVHKSIVRACQGHCKMLPVLAWAFRR